MSTYIAPLHDYHFLLRYVLHYDSAIAALPAYADASLDLVTAVIEEAARFAQERLAPLNRSGDEEGCAWRDGNVTTPSGFKAAYAQYREGGWPGLTASPQYGGQGLPRVVGLIQREIVNAANASFGTYLGLSQGACQAIFAHGTQALKQTLLPAMVEGRWMGTMCLTEPHCGSDLGLIRTRADQAQDGSFRIHGTKIFVTAGEHDLSENIVHMVLARLPDGPPGTKGLSLFAVPRCLPGPDGTWTERNTLECTGIEHKMGIRASATASLAFHGATGWLVGQPHQGLHAMFTMMNASRLGVAVQSVGLAEAALQAASTYARERRQGRSPGATTPAPVPIISHPDVRRNLLIARAFIEGARALWLWAGIQLDRQYGHPDAGVRTQAENLLALLTPVLKAFFSERAYVATNAAMQVFGGHGYIRETGVEQYVRDGRIIPLYEGTNGIQALDLISRKIGMDGGRVAAGFFVLVEQAIATMSQDSPDFAHPLRQALQQLRLATEQVAEAAGDDPHAHGAAGHDYLQLFGLVAMGFAWAKIVAAAPLVADESDRAWAADKRQVARFFFSHMLPQAAYHYACVQAGSAALMALPAERL